MECSSWRKKKGTALVSDRSSSYRRVEGYDEEVWFRARVDKGRALMMMMQRNIDNNVYHASWEYLCGVYNPSLDMSFQDT
jgi:hypothetical protein